MKLFYLYEDGWNLALLDPNKEIKILRINNVNTSELRVKKLPHNQDIWTTYEKILDNYNSDFSLETYSNILQYIFR